MKHKEKKRNEKNNIKIIITILFLTLFTSLLATNNLAQNNPGHDTLYIEQTGDSELTGNFNVTGNTTIQGIQTQNNLVLRGDGEQTGTKARIIGSAGYLSIQSPGDIYINTLSGTTSDVYLGDGSDTVGLIVTGNLSTNGQNVCLADGTNCPAGAAETGNITGSGSTNYIPIWLSGSTLGNSQIQQSGSNIGIGGSPSYKLDISGTFRATGTGIFNGILYPNSGMQIPNTNTEANTIYRDHNSYPALVVGQYGNSGIVEFRQGTTTKVIIDNDGKVGILTTTPNSELDVNGTINATGDICLDDGTCLSSLTNQATSDTGWNDTGTTVQLVTASDNVSAGTLYIDNTN
ncbi:hypothetical protein K9K83_03000, partial [Candidatus Woesearchaeota archaeon]|nr:hypothetical protein [Candidatus Woesearchaeota archaeon]